MTRLTWRAPIVALLMAVWAATAVAQDDRPRSDQEILAQLELDWDAAFYRNDVTFIAKILADDFVAVYEDGKLGDKAKELKFAAEFNQQYVTSRLADITVKVYGDVAVVRMMRYLSGKRGGQPVEDAFRFTDVFAWRDDRWQCVSTQSTKVTP